MRLTETRIRQIVRGILSEGRWERYDTNHTALIYRELVGAENLDRLENEIATIHWLRPKSARSLLARRHSAPWLSCSAYHWGRGKIVSHKNPNDLWGLLGIIVKGDWLYGSRGDAMTGGSAYDTLRDLEQLNLHDPPYDPSRPIPPGMERERGVVTGLSNTRIIRSPEDVPTRPTAAAETEIIVGDPKPIGIVLLPDLLWQLQRLKDEYAEMAAAGEIGPPDVPVGSPGRRHEPDHPSEYEEMTIDQHESGRHDREIIEPIARELARRYHLPLYDESWQEIG